MPKKRNCLTPPCGEEFCGPLNRYEEIDGAIYTPYVSLKIGYGTAFDRIEIATGFDYYAESSLERATITSFEYGYEIGRPGWGATFEIMDYTGGYAFRILQNTNKTIRDANTERSYGNASFNFGWIIKKRDGTDRLYTVESLLGDRLRGTIFNVEQSYEGNAAKVKLEIRLPEFFDQTPQDQVFGSEPTKAGQEFPMNLRPAVEALLTQNNSYPMPKWLNRFNQPLNFDGKTDQERILGPYGKWACSGQTKIDTVRGWLNGVKTKAGRGISIVSDPITGGLAFREDPVDGDSKENPSPCKFSLGTFIINGGDCSPVLEFRPSVNFIAVSGAGPVNTSAGGSGAAGQPFNSANKQKQTYGPSSNTTIPENLNSQVAPEDQAKHVSETHTVHMKANASAEVLSAIEANLKLVGQIYDHTLAAELWAPATVSIVFLNPWFLNAGQTDQTNNLRWTQLWESNCHPVLTNKTWDVVGINYQIQSGNFITNLKLKLLAPNVDIDFAKAYGLSGQQTADANPSPAKPVSATP